MTRSTDVAPSLDTRPRNERARSTEPDTFDRVINLKPAKAIRLTISHSLSQRADRLIR